MDNFPEDCLSEISKRGVQDLQAISEAVRTHDPANTISEAVLADMNLSLQSTPPAVRNILSAPTTPIGVTATSTKKTKTRPDRRVSFPPIPVTLGETSDLLVSPIPKQDSVDHTLPEDYYEDVFRSTAIPHTEDGRIIEEQMNPIEKLGMHMSKRAKGISGSAECAQFLQVEIDPLTSKKQVTSEEEEFLSISSRAPSPTGSTERVSGSESLNGENEPIERTLLNNTGISEHPGDVNELLPPGSGPVEELTFEHVTVIGLLTLKRHVNKIESKQAQISNQLTDLTKTVVEALVDVGTKVEKCLSQQTQLADFIKRDWSAPIQKLTTIEHGIVDMRQAFTKVANVLNPINAKIPEVINGVGQVQRMIANLELQIKDANKPAPSLHPSSRTVSYTPGLFDYAPSEEAEDIPAKRELSGASLVNYISDPIEVEPPQGQGAARAVSSSPVTSAKPTKADIVRALGKTIHPKGEVAAVKLWWSGERSLTELFPSAQPTLIMHMESLKPKGKSAVFALLTN
ncbi:MAG: hypothetical protein [brine shrimp arlivirus 5]|nr:MAG: hypothetical protein [brine shrimp arlivirus 5]